MSAIFAAIPSFQNADGNVIEAYANGGVRENHVAQMARGGDMRVWAEPETGGESYIPHAPSKRARSEQRLAETAEIFGGTYVPAGSRAMADGAVIAGATSAPVFNVVLSAKGGVDLLEYIDVQIEAAHREKGA